jgi:peptidoglycan hydrolase-like protein with peptidoglycan-binding domain
MLLKPGMTGPAVKTIQKALGVSATGTFASTTQTRLKAWQSAHHLPATGVMWQATWVAMLDANGMRR